MYNEHEATPDPKTIIPDSGVMLDEYLARCILCDRWMSGDENYAFHLSEDEIYHLVPSYIL